MKIKYHKLLHIRTLESLKLSLLNEKAIIVVLLIPCKVTTQIAESFLLIPFLEIFHLLFSRLFSRGSFCFPSVSYASYSFYC